MERIAADQRLSRLLLAVTDGMVLIGAGLAAALLRFGAEGFLRELDLILAHPGFIAYVLVVQLGLAITFDLYRPESWPPTGIAPQCPPRRWQSRPWPR